jgi:hypothetical protein
VGAGSGRGERRPLLVTRQSPDWRALARDYRRQGRVDPARFVPAEAIPAFPPNVADLIDRWNATMSIDFFSCRARLKEIADWTLADIPARRIRYDEVEALGPALQGHVIFFHDDDDWFSPGLAGIVAILPFDGYDVCVFNLIRLWTSTWTFVRRGQASRVIVGEQTGFRSRFQSNNYGVNGDACEPSAVVAMKDHLLASGYADANALRDLYVEEIIGVTAKTACSASMLPALFAEPDTAKAQVRRYLDSLQALEVPGDVAWIAGPIRHVVDLFSAAI